MTQFLGKATVFLAVWLLGMFSSVAAAAAGDYVKYYVVADSYAGQPETAAKVAARLLGGSARAGDIVRLNAGRPQPDGPALTRADQSLTPGWAIALPWDAAGAGVMYGRLPATRATRSGCVAGSVANDEAHWADKVLGTASRRHGAGVLVAVVDSGVDVGVPALAGRVTAGADLITGRRGDTDCLGSGTAMAGLIAAEDTGVAPEATIFPVRIATAPGVVDADQAAVAIEVAISAGARVIALGGYTDPDAPAVHAAIEKAVTRGVFVVAPAGAAAVTGDGVLRVGAVAPGGEPGDVYAAGAVEVSAPGVGVAVLGVGTTGARPVSGTAYAVAYVAGTAALVRADFPGLDASAVEQRVERTAARGLIDPRAAVHTDPDSRTHRLGAAVATGAAVVAAGVLVLLRRRRP